MQVIQKSDELLFLVSPAGQKMHFQKDLGKYFFFIFLLPLPLSTLFYRLVKSSINQNEFSLTSKDI